MLLFDPPVRPPWFLRPALWLTRRVTGKDPLPARLLSHYPKGAIAGGLLEAFASHAPGDLDARTLKLARLAAAIGTGCPFCIDMNAAGHDVAGVTRGELDALVGELDVPSANARERAAIDFARALSRTPVIIDDALRAAIRTNFSAREAVVLATTVAQVNYWARLNQGLGVPSAGFFQECLT